MKLRDYLKNKRISIREFAKSGPWPYHTVYSWLHNERQGKPYRIPNSESMRRIMELTNNRVKPNDFYRG